MERLTCYALFVSSTQKPSWKRRFYVWKCSMQFFIAVVNGFLNSWVLGNISNNRKCFITQVPETAHQGSFIRSVLTVILYEVESCHFRLQTIPTLARCNVIQCLMVFLWESTVKLTNKSVMYVDVHGKNIHVKSLCLSPSLSVSRCVSLCVSLSVFGGAIWFKQYCCRFRMVTETVCRRMLLYKWWKSTKSRYHHHSRGHKNSNFSRKLSKDLCHARCVCICFESCRSQKTQVHV